MAALAATTWLMHQKRMIGAICIVCMVHGGGNDLTVVAIPVSSLQRSSSSSSRSSRSNGNENHQPIRKIAVIGGGIASLSLAHAFESISNTDTNDTNDNNVAWKASSEAKHFQQQMRQQIDDAKIPMHTIRPIIDRFIDKADRFFELGIYFHNPFARWTKAMMGTTGNRNGDCNGDCNGNCNGSTCKGVDAAHAVPPFLGQGANQAIQDVYCLANAIRQYNMQCDERANGGISLEDILHIEYKDKRWSTTTSIMDITGVTAKAGLLGYLEASSGPLAKFWDVSFFTMDKTGVAKKIFLDAAVPRV